MSKKKGRKTRINKKTRSGRGGGVHTDNNRRRRRSRGRGELGTGEARRKGEETGEDGDEPEQLCVTR